MKLIQNAVSFYVAKLLELCSVAECLAHLFAQSNIVIICRVKGNGSELGKVDLSASENVLICADVYYLAHQAAAFLIVAYKLALESHRELLKNGSIYLFALYGSPAMMFLLPSLIGSRFLLPIKFSPPVLFLFYHSSFDFYRLFFIGSFFISFYC